MQNNQTKQSDRYVLKFNNGYYKTFDTVDYTDVCLHYLKSQAEEYTANKNKRKAK